MFLTRRELGSICKRKASMDWVPGSFRTWPIQVIHTRYHASCAKQMRRKMNVNVPKTVVLMRLLWIKPCASCFTRQSIDLFLPCSYTRLTYCVKYSSRRVSVSNRHYQAHQTTATCWLCKTSVEWRHYLMMDTMVRGFEPIIKGITMCIECGLHVPNLELFSRTTWRHINWLPVVLY